MTWLLVGIGGALGSVARHGLETSTMSTTKARIVAFHPPPFSGLAVSLFLNGIPRPGRRRFSVIDAQNEGRCRGWSGARRGGVVEDRLDVVPRLERGVNDADHQRR